MVSPKNLTGQITRLREREGGFMPEGQHTPPQKNESRLKGRNMANDLFMWFSYALFAAALVTQLCLIVWLDII
jgi:hypothetical protein